MYRPLMLRYRVALAALLAVMAVIAAVMLAAPAHAHAARAVPASACSGFPHGRTSGHESLVQWARARHSTASEVLIVTYTCRPGWPLALDRYVDKAILTATAPAGIMLYTLGYAKPSPGASRR